MTIVNSKKEFTSYRAPRCHAFRPGMRSGLMDHALMNATGTLEGAVEYD